MPTQPAEGLTPQANPQLSPTDQQTAEYLNLYDTYPSEPTVFEFPPSDPETLRYPDDHPAMQYLRHLIPESLTDGQREALRYYAGNTGQQAIRQSLERGEVPQAAERIDEAMVQSRLPRPTVVYHAVGHRDDRPQETVPGTTFQRVNYTSTTLDFNLAAHWLSSSTIMRMELPAGTPVAVPELNEAEILLARGSTFENGESEIKTINIDGVDRHFTLQHVSLLPGSNAIAEAEKRLAAAAATSASTHFDTGYVPTDPFF